MGIAQTFDFYAVRFRFVAQETLAFPNPASNLFRGAFGSILHRTVPHLYRLIFAPSHEPGPSGFAQPPRPFVLRARHLDGRTLAVGELFEVQFNLFAACPETLVSAFDAFAELAREGLGSDRSKLHLQSASLLSIDATFHECTAEGASGADFPLMSLRLTPMSDRKIDHIRIKFLTPTEIKNGGRPIDVIEFAPLLQRVLERLSTLRALYGPAPLELNFPGLLTRASQVKLVQQKLEYVASERTNRRKEQVHPLGGFVGEAEYQGDLTCFVPFLEAACWTGVGRQTVWGKGEIVVHEQ